MVVKEEVNIAVGSIYAISSFKLTLPDKVSRIMYKTISRIALIYTESCFLVNAPTAKKIRR